MIKNISIQQWQGQSGGPSTAGSEVVSDPASWERLWLNLGQDTPSLDFSLFVAVAVYAGEKPTGGWSPFFDEPALKDGDLLVRWRLPKPAGFVSQSFTRAWKVRAFARPQGRVIVAEAPE